MKQLLSSFQGYYRHMVIGPVFKLAEAVLELMIPLLVADMIDIGIQTGDTQYVLQRGLLMLLLGITGFFCALICQYFAAKSAQGFACALRKKLFRHVFALNSAEYGTLGADTLITRLTSDVNQMQTGVNMFIRLAVRAPFLTIGSIVMAMRIHTGIGMIFLITTPLIILVLYCVMSRSVPFYTHIQAGQDTISRLAGENLAGARVIRAFNRQKSEREAFRKAGDDLAAITVRVGKISAALNPITTIIVSAGILAIIWRGAKLVQIGNLAQGQIIALVSYMTQTLLALIVLANIIVIFTKALASAKRVAAVLDTQPSLQYPPTSAPAIPGAPVVEFQNIGFAYTKGGEHALEDITFTLQTGQTLGIIGGTGCGKTTVARLLQRDYDPAEGTVYLHGVPLQNITHEDLQAQINFVPQTAQLFAGTIRSNLQLANQTASEQAMWQALETAQGAAFVKAKEDGLEARVEEGGKNLSGGQKQRLTIARALLHGGDVLVLDDCASALDYATEAALRKALAAEKITTILISQRIASLKHADCILVLDDGVQCGFGNHETLLQTCDVYREICRSQNIGGVQ